MFAKLSAVTLAVGVMLSAVGTAHAASPAVVGGGSGIIIDSRFECTLTTIGHDRSGNLVGITAGHCGKPGSRIVAERHPGSGQIGRFVFINRDLDYAVIRFDSAKVTPVSHVGNVTIHSIGRSSRFPQVVCKQGRTTGNTCGVTWGPLLGGPDQTWTQLCVIEGDSGAPVVAGTTLVGMVNAYLAVACLGPEVGTDMTAVVQDLDSRHITGSGYHPI